MDISYHFTWVQTNMGRVSNERSEENIGFEVRKRCPSRIQWMMTHFRVVTSVSFGRGGNFLKNHNEDPTPKFVIYLYNEKVLSIQSTLDTHHSTLFHINIDVNYYIIQTDH